MAEIEIYSAALCPFAHRSRLTLLEKGIPFKLIEIDLQNKPKNFKEISPYGKVPVLKRGDQRVWESTIINEYLDETFPDPPLLPKKTIHRAQARLWINFADTRLFAASGKLLYSSEPQNYAAVAKELTEHLQFIEQEGLQKMSADGPYWFGKEISLVDLTYYPFFEQWAVLEHFRGVQFPTGLDRLKQWWDAMTNRESVRAIAHLSGFYLERYGQLEKIRLEQTRKAQTANLR
ncbi:glutathione S-transferase family protein [Stenomitos frigidus]|uniref:glutathione transferase n=1 Tax=Stenomitos frigidus ULC18 TaxID=2107698 RepID=A0A2T1DTE4_9CYAN|nr:glutathione S-transferase family protein [Stenomitos frigidus]PSB23745.1 glutathione S-transferase family protein [Stenomitos frigidus ULC18]